nr:hypothetical protein Iba_chr09fCG7280 [Ipomoea batatas]
MKLGRRGLPGPNRPEKRLSWRSRKSRWHPRSARQRHHRSGRGKPRDDSPGVENDAIGATRARGLNVYSANAGPGEVESVEAVELWILKHCSVRYGRRVLENRWIGTENQRAGIISLS